MLKNQGDVFMYYSFVYISRVKQTAFHQFHGLKSKRRIGFVASLSRDAFQNMFYL